MQNNSVFILGDCNSSHTRKWVEGLISKGLDVKVFSFYPCSDEWGSLNKIDIYNFFKTEQNKTLKKLLYFFAFLKVNRIIKNNNFDLVHAHYASSYGLVGALSKNLIPLVISFWGSDVFYFPRKNWITKSVLKYVLKKADSIQSSSCAMAKEIKLYTDKKVEVVYFGIDTNRFYPKVKIETEKIVIGVVKTMSPIYAIDHFIKSIPLVQNRDFEVLIVGGGNQLEEYKNLAKELGISDKVKFEGRVSHEKVLEKLHKMDVFINVSHNESFGVSILEASACGIPVIVHNKGGMSEVVEHGITGLLINDNQPETIANAIDKIVSDKESRLSMGNNGVNFVKSKFEFNDNLNLLIEIYNSLDARL
jgi:L-malate glycosyltransferase